MNVFSRLIRGTSYSGLLMAFFMAATTGYAENPDLAIYIPVARFAAYQEETLIRYSLFERSLKVSNRLLPEAGLALCESNQRELLSEQFESAENSLNDWRRRVAEYGTTDSFQAVIDAAEQLKELIAPMTWTWNCLRGAPALDMLASAQKQTALVLQLAKKATVVNVDVDQRKRKTRIKLSRYPDPASPQMQWYQQEIQRRQQEEVQQKQKNYRRH